MLLLIVALSIALVSSAAALLVLHRRTRVLGVKLQEVESKHEEFIEQAEYARAIQRKVEAQLLDKQQRLDRLAHHDQLTGLPNRLFLAAHLPLAMEESRKTRTPLAVLFLDLDRFKHVNDTHGHEVGDKLLQEVAQRIQSSVRSEDIVVRMGGDEFVVILNRIKTIEQANETATRILASLNVPLVIAGKPLVTTVSIGLSLFPRDGEDVGALLRHSDTAMYQAKDCGRNNFQNFSPVMDRKLQERVNVEARLRAAVELGQFDVHYQPILDIETRQVVALEALLRWKDPEEGFIAPGRF
ncbi:MAG TPA: diguanylate cyclase, partial [Steroidobacteraceae bacterium]|nr:diguanylate cyclase [Steroidobacteraceae bacterium]